MFAKTLYLFSYLLMSSSFCFKTIDVLEIKDLMIVFLSMHMILNKENWYYIAIYGLVGNYKLENVYKSKMLLEAKVF